MTAVLGVAFWTLAARTFPREAVGVTGAVTAAMALAAPVGTIGMGTVLIAELPKAALRARRDLMIWALKRAAAASALIAAAIVVASPYLGRTLDHLGSPFLGVLFVLGVSGTAAGLVLDQVALVAGSPMAQVLRNGIASVVKLLLIVPVSGVFGPVSGVLLAGWVMGTALGVWIALRAILKQMPRARTRRTRALVRSRRQLRRSARDHNVINLSLLLPSALLPVAMAVRAGASENAAITGARLVSGFVFLAPYAISVALFAASSVDTDTGLTRARWSLQGSMALSVAACVTTLVAAQLMLAIFGGRYAAEGAPLLRLMVLGGPLLVVKDQYVAMARRSGNLVVHRPFIIGGSMTEIAGFGLVAVFGGPSLVVVGWLLGLACEVIVLAPRLSAMLGPVRQHRQQPQSAALHRSSPGRTVTVSMRAEQVAVVARHANAHRSRSTHRDLRPGT